MLRLVCNFNIRELFQVNVPEQKVLVGSSDRKTCAPYPNSLQHSRISELTENHFRVEGLRKLRRTQDINQFLEHESNIHTTSSCLRMDKDDSSTTDPNRATIKRVNARVVSMFGSLSSIPHYSNSIRN